jgi:hypothetical protein
MENLDSSPAVVTYVSHCMASLVPLVSYFSLTTSVPNRLVCLHILSFVLDVILDERVVGTGGVRGGGGGGGGPGVPGGVVDNVIVSLIHKSVIIWAHNLHESLN